MELTNAIFTVHTLLFIAKPMKFFLRLIRKLELVECLLFSYSDSCSQANNLLSITPGILIYLNSFHDLRKYK